MPGLVSGIRPPTRLHTLRRVPPPKALILVEREGLQPIPKVPLDLSSCRQCCPSRRQLARSRAFGDSWPLPLLLRRRRRRRRRFDCGPRIAGYAVLYNFDRCRWSRWWCGFLRHVMLLGLQERARFQHFTIFNSLVAFIDSTYLHVLAKVVLFNMYLDHMPSSFIDLFVLRVHELNHFDFAGRNQNSGHSRQSLRLTFNQPLAS